MKRNRQELELQAVIRDLLMLHGWKVHRLEADEYDGKPKNAATREEPGTPDLIALRLIGRSYASLISASIPQCDSVYIECKSPTGKLSFSQKIWISDARKRGWHVIVARSIDDVKAMTE